MNYCKNSVSFLKIHMNCVLFLNVASPHPSVIVSFNGFNKK